MIWPTIVLQNIQGFIALRMITPCRGYLQKNILIYLLTYPTCKFQSVKTSRVSNHLRIPILVLKVGITKFLYLEYKTTNNPSIKETQMQPMFFVYIFVVRTQKKPHKRQLRKPVGMLTSHPSSLQDVYTIYITVSVYSCPRHYTY